MNTLSIIFLIEVTDYFINNWAMKLSRNQITEDYEILTFDALRNQYVP